jgi:GntR family transcriptional regulator/MocR family aminotransferase
MARHFLSNAGMRLLAVPVDDDGLDVEAGIKMDPDARFALVTPSHQSPLGVSLSLSRRYALLDWARAGDRWIIEDDYDSEYRYRGRPLPALKSLDTGGPGRVLYTGTFSKVLAPGLRLSYLVVPREQVARFLETADRMQNQCPRLLQATLARFIEEGYFARHITKMRNVYADRRAMLADALGAALGMRAHLRLQAGGMHLLAMLENGSDDSAIALRARSLGLSVNSLSTWYAATTSKRGLLMGFTNVRSTEEASALARILVSAL